jgi:hypothetical protein
MLIWFSVQVYPSTQRRSLGCNPLPYETKHPAPAASSLQAYLFLSLYYQDLGHRASVLHRLYLKDICLYASVF